MHAQRSPDAPSPPPAQWGAAGSWSPGWPGGAPGWPQAPRPARGRGLGVAAVLLGCAGAGLCWAPLTSPAGFVLGLLGLVFGLVAAGRARRGEATGRGCALGGIWTGSGAMAVAAVQLVTLALASLSTIEVRGAVGAQRDAGVGEEVRFADGLTAVAEPPVPVAGGAVIVTFRLEQTGDSRASLRENTFFVTAHGRDVPGDRVRRGSAPTSLAAGESGTVEFRVDVEPGTGALALDYAPGGRYDAAFWVLPLDADVRDGEPDSRERGGDGGSDGIRI